MQIDITERAQEVIRSWLRRVLETKNWTPNKLAKAAKISPATISRALNDDQFTTSTTTIEKIVRATGIPAPSGIGLSGVVPDQSHADPEAAYIDAPDVFAEPVKPNDAQSVWQLKSRCIELFGYLPGDFLLVDGELHPRTGDVVCVQIYEARGGTPETVFRVYDPPYVVTKTMDRQAERKPLPVDNERVVISGTVVRSTRVRNA